jgi:hypothetical protein
MKHMQRLCIMKCNVTYIMFGIRPGSRLQMPTQARLSSQTVVVVAAERRAHASRSTDTGLGVEIRRGGGAVGEVPYVSSMTRHVMPATRMLWCWVSR